MSLSVHSIEHPKTLVSLFSGAGGLDIGLERAGFSTVAATDSDRDCIATLKASKRARLAVAGSAGRRRHLAGAGIIEAPIEDLSAKDLRPNSTDADWVPDLLAGGPPCQPFSSSGKGLALRDTRGRLFEHFVRLAAELRPRTILFENVRGLVTARGPRGHPGEALNLVKAAFEEIGYATRFGLLNAADYGAPQRRVRLIMTAAREAPLPELPAPTHAKYPTFEQLPWQTLGDFLQRMPPPLAAEVVRPTETLAAALASVPTGKGLRSPGPRETTRPGGHWGYKQGTFVADLALPARTVTAAATQDWLRGDDGTLRRLSWREAAGLQGFPAAWRFEGKTASRFRQIGNAVPVPLAAAVGSEIAAALLERHDGVRVLSAPLPKEFGAAVAYTRRDESRNGASRRMAREVLLSGSAPVETVKGFGRQDVAEA